MGRWQKYLVVFVTAGCILAAGCGLGPEPDNGAFSDSGNQNSLENLKSRSATVDEYSCDFRRQFGSEEVKGRLYYDEENIRFDMLGATPEDTTVTIVNQEDNKTYTYNDKIAKGYVQEPAAFLLDVPLPGEIMSVLNSDNCAFASQFDLNGQKCTSFQATEVQFFGYKFTGEIAIDNESGLPLFIKGNKGTIPILYEYSNYAISGVPRSTFAMPDNIDFY